MEGGMEKNWGHREGQNGFCGTRETTGQVAWGIARPKCKSMTENSAHKSQGLEGL